MTVSVGVPRRPLSTPQGVLPSLGRTASTVAPPRSEGPFNLLLGLIAKHQLDVTEVALSKVSDEFLS